MDREKLRIYYNFNAKRSKDPIARGGWRNSYDGKLFSEEEMREYADNVYFKLKPYLSESTIVLEIGCASGITMYRIAPHVKKYIGTDMAEGNQKISEAYNRENGIDNIDLHTCYAHEIARLWGDFYPGERADIVLMNSVVQYFETEEYLLEVMEQAAKILAPRGLMFIGDVRDKDKKDEFEQSVIRYYRENNMDEQEIRWKNELFLSRKFFEDLGSRYPFIEGVDITDKVGNIKNESSLFRFDALLRVAGSGFR